MSTPANGDEKVANSRRRRPTSGKPKGRRPRRAEDEEGKGPVDGEGKPTYEMVPVPEELQGTKQTGVISVVVRRSKYRFGFIAIGKEDTPEAPKIYFRFTEFKDVPVLIRRSYPVVFTVSKDDQGRASAMEISLTEEGKQLATTKEAAYQEKKKTEKETIKSEDAPKRAPRVRKVVEPKLVSLKFTCDAKPGVEKTEEVDANLPIGRIRNIATTLFEITTRVNVYHINSAGEQVFLTKGILSSLEPGSKIHLTDAPETTEEK